MGASLIAGIGGVASGIGSLVGASDTSDAANKAAQAQYAASSNAQATAKQYYGYAQNDLSPYMNLGAQGAQSLEDQLGNLTSAIPVPGAMSEANLESTPGYQFTLDQGLKATQNSAAARGLGVSGAAMKGAASYATGLSDQTYDQRFNQAQTNWQDAVTNQSNSFNRLFQTAGMGTQAAGALAGDAINTGNAIGGYQTGAGNAAAAADNATGKADASAATGVGSAFNNALSQYMSLSRPTSMYGGNSGSSGNALYGSAGTTQPTVGGSYQY